MKMFTISAVMNCCICIDTRQFSESRWIAAEFLPRQFWGMKISLKQQGGSQRAAHDVIRLECGDVGRAKVIYYRGSGAGETGTGQRTIKFAAGAESAALTRYSYPSNVGWIETGTSYSQMVWIRKIRFLSIGVTKDVVEIVESESANTPPRITKLSRQDCRKRLRRCVSDAMAFSRV